MKTLNDTQLRCLLKSQYSNVAGYMIRKGKKEKLYAMAIDGRCFEKKEREYMNAFGKNGFTSCSNIPDDALFIGYYQISMTQNR